MTRSAIGRMQRTSKASHCAIISLRMLMTGFWISSLQTQVPVTGAFDAAAPHNCSCAKQRLSSRLRSLPLRVVVSCTLTSSAGGCAGSPPRMYPLLMVVDGLRQKSQPGAAAYTERLAGLDVHDRNLVQSYHMRVASPRLLIYSHRMKCVRSIAKQQASHIITQISLRKRAASLSPGGTTPRRPL